MRKVKFSTDWLLGIILLCICILHACSREHCRVCTATKDGEQPKSRSICSDPEEVGFRSQYEFNGYTVDCN
jgi:hypothetical protein